jgi:hypothetical protein
VEAPLAFVEALRLVDPNLSPMWDSRMQRWKIHLRNPRRPNSPPVTVKIVTEPDGTYRPLDNRTIKWLLESDLQRRFHGYREDQFGRLLDQAMLREEESFDKERSAKANDQWDEVMDKAKFEYRRLERRRKI